MTESKMRPSYYTLRVASGANPFSTLESIQEAGFLGPIFRFVASQALGYAVNKGVQKGIAAGSSHVDKIMADAEKEEPVVLLQKLHALANHPGTKGTHEGERAAEHARRIAKKHNLVIGPEWDSKAKVDKAAIIGKELGKHAVNKNTWQDTMNAFKSGREGK
jgi:hypothetical protein